LFGSFRVETAAGEEIEEWIIQKARELLAYILAHGGSPVNREKAQEALWPEGDPRQTNHQLSQAATTLRYALKCAGGERADKVMVTVLQRYQLRNGVFRIDVEAFDAHMARAEKLHGADAIVEYERVLALYQGDLLSDETYEWADRYRHEYQKRFVAGAKRAATLAIDCRDLQKAIEFYEAIVKCDPLEEEAVRGLMRCCASLEDSLGVRRAYRNLVAALERDLGDGTQPQPETTRAFEELTRRHSVAR
jgi:two-component SAPR family response regulator